MVPVLSGVGMATSSLDAPQTRKKAASTPTAKRCCPPSLNSHAYNMVAKFGNQKSGTMYMKVPTMPPNLVITPTFSEHNYTKN